ncbi:MAG: sigma-70 family RNA polymerase sigma factor [Mariniblastus sp.]|nr:sigma-70 family RNA polymerase sigma factor [Mariniblastus sp.]
MLNCSDNHGPAVAEPITNREFFRNASTNDPGTWETIVHRYSRLIDFWCLTYGVPRSELDNYRQEVFIRLAGSIGRFQPKFAQSSFQAFLKTITRNQVFSAHRETDPCGRAGSLPQEVLNAVAQDSPRSHQAELTEAKSALYQKTIKLIQENFSPDHAYIFTEYVVQQRKPADIADELNISTNVVYQVRSRILNYLRLELGSPQA